jgi:hypothetical protein
LPQVQGQESQDVNPDTGDSAANPSPTQRPENPLDRPPVWKVSFQQRQEALRVGRLVDESQTPPRVAGTDPVTGLIITGTETAVTNSAGDPFDPTITYETSYPVASVTMNQASFSMPNAAEIQDCVNATPWRGYQPRVLRIIGIEAQSAFENGVSYWSVTYTLAVNWRTWDFRILDAGYRELTQLSIGLGGGVRLDPIKSPFGDIGPSLLDGKGKSLLRKLPYTTDGSGTITVTGHGLSADIQVTVYPSGGGSPVQYYVRAVVDDDHFTVSTKMGGGPATPASGSGVVWAMGSEKYRRYSVYRTIDFNTMIL